MECELIQLEDFSHIDKNYYRSKNHLPNDWFLERERQIPWNQKRMAKLKEWLPDISERIVLDFGSGTGGFLEMAQGIFKKVYGFDLGEEVCRMHCEQGWHCVSSLAEIPSETIDTLTLFHVLEHSPTPWALLEGFVHQFHNLERIVIEVPHTEEALLTLFQSDAYRKNHHHTQHLYYFTTKTLRNVVEKSGLVVETNTQLQRYSLANHLGWLANHKGGGQDLYCYFNEGSLNECYEEILIQQKKADSLFFLCKT